MPIQWAEVEQADVIEKLIPLIYSAAKKKVDLITLPECATFLNVNKSETMINASFERNSLSLKVIKEIAKDELNHVEELNKALTLITQS